MEADGRARARRGDGAARPGRPVVVLLSGGRDSVCLLDVARRAGGAGAVSALHVNYGLRDEADADEEHCARCARGSASRSRSSAPRAPTARRATCRRGRATSATRAARARGRARAAPASPPAHTATDQVETILYRLAVVARPPRAARDAPRARAARAPAARRHARGDRAPGAARAGCAGARTRATTAAVTRARACATALVPALRAVHPAAEAQRRCAPPRCCATRPRCSTRRRRRRSPAATGSRVEHLRGAAAARSRGSSCGGSPRTRPARSCPRRRAARSTTSLGAAATARVLDVGDGARAVVERRRAALRAHAAAARATAT